MTPDYAKAFEVILQNQLVIMKALETDAGPAVDKVLRQRQTRTELALRELGEQAEPPRRSPLVGNGVRAR